MADLGRIQEIETSGGKFGISFFVTWPGPKNLSEREYTFNLKRLKGSRIDDFC